MRSPLRIVLPALASFGLLACSSSDPVTSQGLATSSVTSEKIADKSVTNPKLADNAVDARAIATGAVTPAAIASGAVTAPAIADNSITSPAIADGSVATSDLAAKAVTTGILDDKAVTTPKLNDGAVTAAKLAPNAAVLGLNGLTGAVSIVKGQNIAITPNGNSITVGLTGNVDAYTIRGNDPATFAPRDTHVITVAKNGGDFASIGAAMGYATTGSPALTGVNWPGAPSATNPYVIRIGPGTFTETVTMVPYVDIQGSGIDATTIAGAGTSNPVSEGLIKWPANVHSRLENLTVSSNGGQYGVGVNVNDTSLGDTTQANLWKVRIVVSGAMQDGYGVYLYGAAAKFSGTQVEVDAVSSGGTNTAAEATTSAHLTCRDCTFSAQGASAITVWGGSGTTIHVSNSMVDGPSNFSGTATVGCVGNFNAGFQALTTGNGC